MSIFEEYNEFFDILWFTDDNGNKISIQRLNEQHKIVNNKILLNNVPDFFRKVVITDKYEINIGKEIASAEYFKTNYLTGEVYFHSSLEGQTITIAEYWGRGLVKIMARRTELVNKDKLYTSDNVEDFATEVINKINSDKSYLQNQINTNEADIENKLQQHKDSTTAHKDDSINNTSVVAGSKVKDALNSLKTKDDQLNSRIDNIISQSGTSSTEVVDARNSAKYGTFASLDARLEGIETRSKYFARENHTVLTNASTITLTNLPENNHELLIYDTKYGVIWDKNIHWTRSGATITFTSAMPEDLSFVVINLG